MNGIPLELTRDEADLMLRLVRADLALACDADLDAPVATVLRQWKQRRDPEQFEPPDLRDHDTEAGLLAKVVHQMQA